MPATRLILGAPLATMTLAGCLSLRPQVPSTSLPYADEHTFAVARISVDDEAAPIPLRDARGHALLLQASVNGHDPAWFILDTGAGACTISPYAARRFNLAPVASVTMNAAARTTVYAGDSLRAGPLRIDAPRFVALQMDWSPAAFGVRVDGVLGPEAFLAGPCEIDVAALSFTFLDSDPGLDWIPIDFINNLPHVRVAYPGGEGLMLIDTGYGGGILFSHDASPDLPTSTGRARRVMGFGLSQRIREVTLDWLQIGAMRFQSVPASVPLTAGRDRAAAGHIAGQIGLEVLRRSRLVLDFPRARCALLPPR